MDKYKKKTIEDVPALSKNHSKSVRYRLRVQQQTEATEEIKAYEQDVERESHELHQPRPRDTKPFL